MFETTIGAWRIMGPDKSVTTEEVLSEGGRVKCVFTCRVGGLAVLLLVPTFAGFLRAMRLLR